MAKQTLDMYNSKQLAVKYYNAEMGVTKTLEEWADEWDDFLTGSFAISDFKVFKSEYLVEV